MLIIAAAIYLAWIYSDRSWTPTIIFAVIALVATGFLWHDRVEVTTRTIVVESKDRGGEDGSYRVYTDGDTLSVKDIYLSLGNFRTNSADLYGDIKPCHRYIVALRGWEFGFLFSEMPNIDHIVKDLGPVDGCKPTN